MTIETRIFNKDYSLWSTDEKVVSTIANRLGWLDCVEFSRQHASVIKDFVASVRASGFQKVVLLGMGGSGLAPEVFSRIFSQQENGLELFVLDSTCTEQILALEERLEFSKTLFLVSSKSGGTLETKSLFHYFYNKLRKQCKGDIGQQFAAITDQGSELEQLAKDKNFLQCFINPTDIGGRFSALSYFGLVPAALLGLSIDKLLDRAQQAVEECKNSNKSAGSLLGNWLYQGYQEAQLDKLLIVTNEHLQPLTWWIEQLVAESLGKQENGILPTFATKDSEQLENKHAKVLHLRFGAAGFQVDSAKHASWGLKDEYDVAAQFFHWEFATAIAAAHMQLNPFDEPNVTEAKIQTQQLLDAASGNTIDAPSTISIGDLLSNIQADSYIGILAYLPISSSNREILSIFADRVYQKARSIVTVNFGPRYLHSTGQIHKGGKKQGAFLVVIESNHPPIDIPNQEYSFQDLCRAQAFGDCQALASKGLPVSVLELENPEELKQVGLS